MTSVIHFLCYLGLAALHLFHPQQIEPLAAALYLVLAFGPLLFCLVKLLFKRRNASADPSKQPAQRSDLVLAGLGVVLGAALAALAFQAGRGRNRKDS